jgi:hypothetical protein
MAVTTERGPQLEFGDWEIQPLEDGFSQLAQRNPPSHLLAKYAFAMAPARVRAPLNVGSIEFVVDSHANGIVGESGRDTPECWIRAAASTAAGSAITIPNTSGNVRGDIS